MVANERGQSFIEVLLALPVLIGLFVVMVRSNTVIQMSIVNQKYSRAQALYLTHFSSQYPRREFTEGDFTAIGREKNRMVMGVADNVYNDNSAPQTPLASKYRITRAPNQAQDQFAGINAPQIANVRVYNTVALCTHSVVAQSGVGAGGLQPLVIPNRPSTLSETSQFMFCYSANDQAGGSVP